MQNTNQNQENAGASNQEKTKTSGQEIMTTSLEESMRYLSERMKPDKSFDVVYRVINVGGRQACIYFIDGFCKGRTDDEDPAVFYRFKTGKYAGQRI